MTSHTKLHDCLPYGGDIDSETERQHLPQQRRNHPDPRLVRLEQGLTASAVVILRRVCLRRTSAVPSGGYSVDFDRSMPSISSLIDATDRP